jgi:hypothetical protein
MKSYTVAYLDGALEKLASIWENATDRSVIAQAADTADNILASSPLRHAVPLSEGLWRLDVDPLRIYFTLQEEDRLVQVGDVFLRE